MPEADALFWALRATYGAQCLETDHALTFVGHGFLAHLRPGGKVSLRVSEGECTAAPGWLLASLADFLGPAGGRRDAQGVALLVGRHILRFRGDGTVGVEGLADGDRPDTGGAPQPRAVVAPAHRPGEFSRTLAAAPAGGEPTARERPTEQAWPSAEAPLPATVHNPPAPPAPDSGEITEAITALSARWAQPLPEGELTVSAHRALLQDLRDGRAAVNDLLARLRNGEVAEPGARRRHLRALAALDGSLRAATLRDRRRPRRSG